MDFEEKVSTDYYNSHEPEFMPDLRAWLAVMGVPERYSAAVAAYAWSEGHSAGFREVFGKALELTEIFE